MANTPDIKKLGFNWPKLERIEGDVRKLEEEQTATTRRLNELAREARSAEAADREAYAAALLEGKEEPKTSEAEKLKREREALERRRGALNSALGKLAARRTALMRENRAAWQSEILAKLPNAQSRTQEAGRELLAAVSEVNQLASLHDWIVQPERGYRNRTPAHTVTVNHQQIPAPAAVEALVSQAASIGVQERRSA